MQVEYEDGESETVLLAVEAVRLLMSPGEVLLPPAPDELQDAAAAVSATAGEAASDEVKLTYQSRAEALAKSAAAVVMPAAFVDRGQNLSEHISATVSTQPALLNEHRPEKTSVTTLEAATAPATATAPAAAAAAAAPPAGAAAVTEVPQATMQNSTVPKGSKAVHSGNGSAQKRCGNRAAGTGQTDVAFQPGDVVWCGIKGWCHWPALIVTHLDLDELKVPGEQTIAPLVIRIPTPDVS
jgi:hypothetical protein